MNDDGVDTKQNRCPYCQTLFTPAFRHPHQTCCGKRKCVLAKRAIRQKQKMQEDPVYRQNQRDSNRTWRENHPDYWKNYREKHLQTAARNRLKQQVRNQKKRNVEQPAATANLKKGANRYWVDWIDELQGKDLWLVSSGAVIPPIKLILLVQDKTTQPNFENGVI
jgi:hypothetical protein